MNVKELIDLLTAMPQDAEVHFSYNYGDHWRTVVAPIVDQVEELCIKHSDYHNMDKVVDDEDAYDDDSGELAAGVTQVVVLS